MSNVINSIAKAIYQIGFANIYRKPARRQESLPLQQNYAKFSRMSIINQVMQLTNKMFVSQIMLEARPILRDLQRMMVQLCPVGGASDLDVHIDAIERALNHR